MIGRRHRFDALKIVLLVLWGVSLFSILWLLHAHGIHLREIPRLLRHAVRDAGWLGPLFLLAVYLIRTVVPLPMTSLTVLTGSIYGPVFGSLVAIIGLNLTGMLSFWFGRFLGHHFVDEFSHGWIKKYVGALEEDGFFAVTFMRLLFFPFDIVSIGCGLTAMPFRQFALGTFLGTLPETITFVVLGDAITDPRTWLLFGALLIVSVVLAVLLHRSNWAKKRLLKHVEPVISE